MKIFRYWLVSHQEWACVKDLVKGFETIKYQDFSYDTVENESIY